MSYSTNISHSLLTFYQDNPTTTMPWDDALEQACNVAEKVDESQFWFFTNCLAQWGPLTYPQYQALELFYSELKDREFEYGYEDTPHLFETNQLPRTNKQLRDLLARCCQDLRVPWSEARYLAGQVFRDPPQELKP